MGYYCTVPQCTSLAGKTKNVKFHRFPRDVTMADKWNTILKRGKPYTKYSKVCSLHFTQADYNVTTMGQWKTLSKDAVPSQNLPRLNPDGTVMVIRKSRTVRCRESKKDDGEQDMKWPAMSPTPVHGSLLEVSVTETHDPNVAYRLQTLNTIANVVSPIQLSSHSSQGSSEPLTPTANQCTSQSQPSNPGHVKPKKQDAIMQTDPVQDDPDALNVNYDSSEKSYESEQVDCFSQKDPLEPDYPTDKQKYDTPKDYTKTSDDYIPQTNDEYNKEAEKYALERKSHGGFDKMEPGYHKSVVEYGMRYDDQQKYRDGYLSYQNGYPDTVDHLRQQQVNMQMLQESHRAHETFAEKQIKREDDEETDPLSPLYERRTHQQRLLEQLQHQLKQEPDQNAHETVMQPQGSPFYQSNVHNNIPATYYEVPLSRPGPELLIAKQNALAAHTQLWQNTMKRPFFYSETPQLLHRYEDATTSTIEVSDSSDSTPPPQQTSKTRKKEDKATQNERDDATSFGNFVASAVRNMRSDDRKKELKRRIRRVIQEMKELEKSDQPVITAVYSHSSIPHSPTTNVIWESP